MDFQKKISIWLPLIIGACIAIGILIGSTFSIFNSRKSLFNRGDKLEAVLEYINESYVDTVNIQELVESSIPQIIAGLDPHSSYISAKEMELTGDDLSGHFSGIGVQFFILNDTITIVSVIDEGPSKTAGIEAGDRIVYANDSLLAGVGITNERVFEQLRGKKGTTVNLGIKRYNENEIRYFTIERDDVPDNSIEVVFTPINGVGYIKLSKFSSTTKREFLSAISQLKSQNIKSFVIDLRQNSGGLLQPAIDLANEFLQKGQLIVYTEGRAYKRTNYSALGTGTCQDDQLILLIDEGSASASEVFAGAIQDHDRGLIIGRRSFGKGLVQNPFPFQDNSVLRLTIARYYTPSGRCIQKPYEKGHSEDYSQDLMNRYLRGEFDSQDSIKLDYSSIFYTDAGRKIYGHGGIMPDVFVPRDTVGINSYYTKLMNGNAVYEFALEYTDQNRKQLKSFKSWKDMLAHLNRQPLVQDLVSFAETNKKIRRQPLLVNETQDLLQRIITSYIIRNFFGNDGYYPVILRNDIVLKKALDLASSNKAIPEEVKKYNF
ncbi:S41 family peptidase [Dysgonomonas sp. 520]|uniref:S41 family peptidase n=1 Tax=Dysgonomonas sp. 520 TaxID=2302931 RepID=UPI0013D12412|nr:S41 family peptidase [Dysgonomonas sp. 520]NDW09176.1 S41 family peptidase [Dysgonomonas sp. 520]